MFQGWLRSWKFYPFRLWYYIFLSFFSFFFFSNSLLSSSFYVCQTQSFLLFVTCIIKRRGPRDICHLEKWNAMVMKILSRSFLFMKCNFFFLLLLCVSGMATVMKILSFHKYFDITYFSPFYFLFFSNSLLSSSFYACQTQSFLLVVTCIIKRQGPRDIHLEKWNAMR